MLGDQKEAIANLRRALRKQPDDPTLRLSLGRTRLEDKDYAGALTEANAVLEKDPNNVAARFLKVDSQGRAAPTSAWRPSAPTQAGQATQTVATTHQPTVAFTSTPKRGPIVREVPTTQSEPPTPKDGKPLPLWPLAIPLSGAMIGYGIYKGQQTTTWGENAELDKPAKITDMEIGRNRKLAKAAGMAGAVLVGGYAVAALGPYAVAGAEAFFAGMGPSAGGLALAGGGTAGGAVSLSPAAVTAGANALGTTTILVGSAKVASDYYSNSSKESSSRRNDAGKVKPKKGDFLEKLERVKSKGSRTRWIDEKGRILEWDSQHGELEVYNGRGQHVGVRDPNTGEWIKPAIPGRTIEP